MEMEIFSVSTCNPCSSTPPPLAWPALTASQWPNGGPLLQWMLGGSSANHDSRTINIIRDTNEAEICLHATVTRLSIDPAQISFSRVAAAN